MKRKFRTIIGLLLIIGILTVGCISASRMYLSKMIVEDGGTRNNTNYDAPKAIESTRILAFSCYFSALPLMEEDSRLAGYAYQLEAKADGSGVSGIYAVRERYNGETQPFQADADFMAALQMIVAKHDLAQYNGISYYVYGLPDDYGASLSVYYESGESIHASDNQDCFLSIAAMEELEALFRAQAESHPIPAAPDSPPIPYRTDKETDPEIADLPVDDDSFSDDGEIGDLRLIEE